MKPLARSVLLPAAALLLSLPAYADTTAAEFRDLTQSGSSFVEVSVKDVTELVGQTSLYRTPALSAASADASSPFADSSAINETSLASISSPNTLGMLIAGFAMLGFVASRRSGQF